MLKKIIFSLVVLMTLKSFGQDVFMQNGMVSQCTGVFYDSGGGSGNYDNDENLTLTICPENAGEKIRLNFTEFSTELNIDILTIYDGDDNTATPFGSFSGASSPGLVEASNANTTGCLTIEFVSNGSNPGPGWAANIICVTPCQDITANIDSTTPSLQTGNLVVADVNETITFNGSGTFSVDGTGATYLWNFGDGNTGTGATTTHTYTTAGIYTVTLVITDTNPSGCQSTNDIGLTTQIGASNPGNPYVDAGDDVTIPCDETCTDITAEFLDIGETNTYLISQIPFIPPFSFDGLSNSVNTNIDDAWNSPQNLPFDFCFFANIETQFQVGSNGVIRFDVDAGDVGTGSNGYVLNSGDDLPNNLNPTLGEANIFTPCHDIDPSENSTNEIRWEIIGTAPNRVLAVSYFEVPLYSCTSLEATHMAVLYETTNVIDIYIRDKPICTDFNGGRAVVGIQNNPGTNAFVPPGRNISNSPWTTADEAWRFTPAGPSIIDFTWLNASGTVIGNTPTINVCPTTTETYTARVVYTSCNGGQVTITDDVVVFKDNPFTVDLGDNLDLCEGDSDVILDADIGSATATYQWFENGILIPAETGSTLTVSSPNSATYLTIVNDQSCELSDEVVVTFSPLLTPTFTEIAPICAGDTLTPLPTTSNNGITGTWSPALNNTTTTTYTFTPNAGQDCVSDTSLDIVVNPYTTPAFTTVDPICEGETLNPLPTTSNNGITGVWSPALDNTTTTTYTFTPNAGQGCINPTTLDITVNPNITPTFDAVAAICEGDTLTALPTTSNNGITGTWSPAIDNTTTTTYTFTPNAGQCAISSTLNIVVTSNITPSFTAVASICEGDTLSPLPTTSNNGITGVWSPALDNTVTTTYTFTPDAGQDCATTTTLEIIVTSNITPTFDAVASICEGDTLSPLPTTSNNGITGIWSPALDNTTTTTYTFTPNAGQGCVVSTTLEIIVTPYIVPTFDAVSPICDGDSFAALPTTSNNGITGLWSPAINNTTTTTYTFTPAAGQCALSTTLTLEVNPNPVANPPSPLAVCDDDNDGVTSFDLSIKDIEVIAVQTNMIVSYHSTDTDAEGGINPLAIPYTNINLNTELIHVRIENTLTGCYAITTLQLIVDPLPSTITVSPYALCDVNNTGDEAEAFDLSSKDNEVTNGQTNIDVNYYANQTDANAGINALISPYTNTSNPQTIFAVLTNTLTNCTSSTTFDLVVNPLPIPVAPTPLEVCDDNTPDGITQIDLTLKNTEISSNNPNYAVSYYLTLADAEAEANPLSNPYTNISNPQTIWVRVEDINTSCYATTTLELIIEQAPVANGNPSPLRYCDPDNDGFGQFTLTDADNDITSGASGLTVSYHETPENANNNVDAITTSVPYNNIVQNTQTLWVRVESATIATDCATIVELQLIVEPTPQLVDPSPLEACDDSSADGFAQFDLTTKDPEILDGQDPTQYQVSYYETEVNADTSTNPITNPTSYTNTTPYNQTLWVRVDDTATINDCYKLTSLTLIVNPVPVLVQPDPLELCDVINSGDEREAFTLEAANAQILNGQTGITITYYETQANADAASNPVTSPYTNTSNPQTLFIRAQDDITSCYSTITLTLRVNPVPSPEPNPEPIEVCDDDNDGFAAFDLEQRTIAIINGESDVQITYHETQANADAGLEALTSPYTNIVENTQVLYVRSENTITGCYSLTQNTLELIVLPSPEVPIDIEDYVICDTDDDGFAQFDLTTKADEILNGQVPTEHIISYHINQSDAQSGSNPISNAGNYTNTSNPQIIYVRLESTINDCNDIGQFNIRVELPPTAIQPSPLELCDDFNEMPGDQTTSFDLTLKDDEITGGIISWTVSYYETQADAQAQTNAIVDPTQYTNTSNAQTLFIVVTDNDTGCVDFTTLTLRVLSNPTPTPSDQLPALELCDDNTPGDGTEVFDLTQNEILIINGEEGLAPLSYHQSFEDAEANINAIADPMNYDSNTTLSNLEETIYVRLTYVSTGCFSIVNFTIRVNALPEVVAISDYILCDVPFAFDGIAEFDLTTKTEGILNGQDPNIFTVSYYETQIEAQTQTNAIANPEAYTNMSNPQQIFVSLTNTTTNCFISTPSFNIEVDDSAVAQTLTPLEVCDDNIETDGDTTNDSRQIDLSQINADVLGTMQDPNNFSVSYYLSQDDADMSINQLPSLYENISNPQTIYVRVDNNTLEVINFNLNLTDLTTAIDLNADGVADVIDITVVPIVVDVDNDGNNDVLASFIDTDGDIILTQIDADADGNPDVVDLDGDGQVGDNQADSSTCFDVTALTLQVNPLPNFSLADSYVLCLNTNGTEVLDNPLVIDTGLSETDYDFEWVATAHPTIVLGTQSSFSPQSGGNYTVTVTDLVTGCTPPLPTDIEVLESAPPTLSLEVLTPAFANSHTIQATASGDSLDGYEYNLDGGPWQDSGLFTDVSQGEHTIFARDKTGCGYVSGLITVIDYPLYFTPNGDGNHDTWNITDTQGQLSNVKIYIFDRYGKFIKQISPTGDGWDGTYNGNPMPTNDYWFTIIYTEQSSNTPKEFKAHFALKR